MFEPKAAGGEQIGEWPGRAAGLQPFYRRQGGGPILREQWRVGPRVGDRQHAALGQLPNDPRGRLAGGFEAGTILVAELHPRRGIEQQHGGDWAACSLAEPVVVGLHRSQRKSERHERQERGRHTAARHPASALPLDDRRRRHRRRDARQ